MLVDTSEQRCQPTLTGINNGKKRLSTSDAAHVSGKFWQVDGSGSEDEDPRSEEWKIAKKCSIDDVKG